MSDEKCRFCTNLNIDDNKPREQLEREKTGLANYFQQRIHRYIPAGWLLRPIRDRAKSRTLANWHFQPLTDKSQSLENEREYREWQKTLWSHESMDPLIDTSSPTCRAHRACLFFTRLLHLCECDNRCLLCVTLAAYPRPWKMRYFRNAHH